MYVVTRAYAFRSAANFINVITKLVSRWSVNEISKCLVQRSTADFYAFTEILKT